ncbi:MAG TPA: FAD-dependent oxidoreductase [Polyangiaceae bacterium]|nr:FAD-dependent oxidoreductase [Polyangiaceae bacterium]
MTARIGIVGGGLSGLCAASLLEAHRVDDYVLFEAQETLGGRIVSVAPPARALGGQSEGSASPGRFDLGATWFWPAMQPGLDRRICDLGLETFEQPEAGDLVLESSPHAAPARVPGFQSSPPSRRLAGGMGTLVDALRRGVTESRLLRGQRVRRLCHEGPEVVLEAQDASGRATFHRVAHVLLALPPRLAATTLAFTPPLPDALARAWQDAATWMAPHAKYVAVYDEPFWRGRGLSGEARSRVGPLVEVHDASDFGGAAALFGFLGVPAGARSRLAEDDLRAQCRAQLARLFGPPAGAPMAEFLKDWAADPYVATPADRVAPSQHRAAPPARVPSGAWRDRLFGIASEWSPDFPGYVAGALDAATRGVAAALEAPSPRQERP